MKRIRKRYYCLYFVVANLSGVYSDYTYLLKTRSKITAIIKRYIYAKVLSNALRNDPKYKQKSYISIEEHYL